eukprot:CAMPEP_0175043928 /NCGR_PEP_ID=MMETSP0052_2-20121109/3492_1 /TAXON_ID=51329 ORGANISM="Polytomella parva, Strain SAG 63-3" /NCGR_SAMPLE_ID=MMETSP0052_2 /ASSEMBLY_ACC=CAM_ASM_000194 /LENGTH=114 /DNA_ID=CAMNT_0016307107 /DNA_START=58 /DNA_END=401 /DNA_ORIENTATION=-
MNCENFRFPSNPFPTTPYNLTPYDGDVANCECRVSSDMLGGGDGCRGPAEDDGLGTDPALEEERGVGIYGCRGISRSNVSTPRSPSSGFIHHPSSSASATASAAATAIRRCNGL